MTEKKRETPATVSYSFSYPCILPVGTWSRFFPFPAGWVSPHRLPLLASNVSFLTFARKEDEKKTRSDLLLAVSVLIGSFGANREFWRFTV